MKLTYDLRHDRAYLRLCAKPATVETIHVSDELNVEVAPDGTVCGIAFLKAQQQLTGTDHGQLVIVNEAKGEQRQVPLGLAPAFVFPRAPLWQLKLRGNPLTELQELVLRLREEEKLTQPAIAARVGLSLERVRQIAATAKAIREDYARHGVDALLLLPSRVRHGLDNLNLVSRAQVKAAIAAGELRGDEQWKRCIYKGRPVRNTGWESWQMLEYWASADWEKVSASQRDRQRS